MPKTNAKNELQIDRLMAMVKKEISVNLLKIKSGKINVTTEIVLHEGGIRSTDIDSGVKYSV